MKNYTFHYNKKIILCRLKKKSLCLFEIEDTYVDPKENGKSNVGKFNVKERNDCDKLLMYLCPFNT